MTIHRDGDISETDKRECFDGVYDTGFFTCMDTHNFQHLSVLRKTSSSGSPPALVINELRPYRTPNLLEIQSGVATVSAPAPKSPAYAASNLIKNLSTRSSGNDLYPLVAGDQVGTAANYRSCYKTTNSELSPSHELKIEFNLGESLF